MLNILVAGELCVCDIVTILHLPQPMVSRHLAFLRNAELVEVTREWKYAHYRIARPSNTVHRTLISCVRSCFAGIDSLDCERDLASRRLRERESDPC
ncbi:MAG: metalloregulator ArsR/SmtB family transcription factor [Gemmatimonadaceae bacterium]